MLNAANEVAVEAFLAGSVGFLAIARIVETVLAGVDGGPLRSLEDVLAIDGDARRAAAAAAEREGARTPPAS